MKKLIGITAILCFFTLSITAQGINERKRDGDGMRQGPEFTTEQKATLQTKKMALKLDLDENQQKKVHKMMLKSAEEREQMRKENQQNRKEGVKPTSDEIFNRQNMRLEKQQAHKNEMKKILNNDQYEKWQKSMMVRSKKGTKGKMSDNKRPMNQRNNTPKQLKNKG